MCQSLKAGTGTAWRGVCVNRNVPLCRAATGGLVPSLEQTYWCLKVCIAVYRCIVGGKAVVRG